MTVPPDRRALTLGLAAFGLLLRAPAAAAQGALSPDDQALVDKAVAYLEGLTEARAKFAQTDARGRTTTGQLFLKRPGKARFAYDPPSGLTVVSDGHVVMVNDERLHTFDQYPLGTTPLSLFLAKTIRLDRGVAIQRVARSGRGFAITARDGKKQTAGEITLVFDDSPLALTGWSVTDAQGRATRVQLLGLERASGLDKQLFTMKAPRLRKPGEPA